MYFCLQLLDSTECRMKNIDKLNNLLADTQKLTDLLAARKNTNEYTISFFSQAFETAHHLLIELHALEAEQMELFSKQLEAHQSILNSLTTNIQPAVSPFEEITRPKEILPIEDTVEPEQVIDFEVALETIEVNETIEVSVTAEIIEPVKVVEPAFANYVHNFVDNFVDKPVNNSTDKGLDSTINQPIDKLVDTTMDKGICKLNRPDFKKAFTLNDLFLFRRELFKSDNTLMNSTIEYLNQIETLDKSLTYLQQEFSFDAESQTTKSFIALLEKRFA